MIFIRSIMTKHTHMHDTYAWVTSHTETRHIHMNDMTHSYVWHDPSICSIMTKHTHMHDTYAWVTSHNETRHIHINDITHSHVWPDPSIRDTRNLTVSAVLSRDVEAAPWLIVSMYPWHYVFYAWYDSFIRGTRDSTVSAVQTRLFLSEWHDSFTRSMRDTTHSYVIPGIQRPLSRKHDLFYPNDMTHSMRDTTHSYVTPGIQRPQAFYIGDVTHSMRDITHSFVMPGIQWPQPRSHGTVGRWHDSLYLCTRDFTYSLCYMTHSYVIPGIQRPLPRKHDLFYPNDMTHSMRDKTHRIYVPVTLRILCVIQLIHRWYQAFNGLFRANTTPSIRMTWRIRSFYAQHDSFNAQHDSFTCDTRDSTASAALRVMARRCHRICYVAHRNESYH